VLRHAAPTLAYPGGISMLKPASAIIAMFAGLLSTQIVLAQALPPGPKVTITAVTQLAPTLPQYTKIDIPMLREAVPKSSGGRVEINLKSYPEMNVQGPEVIRLVRSGQVDIGGGIR
jgi:TRAP-type transport system periplasmic protein